MATVTIDSFPGTQQATQLAETVILNPGRSYELVHNGKDVNGTDATNDVIVTIGDLPLLSLPGGYEAIEGRFPLKAGRSAVLLPGITKLYLACASGEPTVSIFPGLKGLADR